MEPTWSWNIKGVDDLNGDGRGDLLWRNTNTGATAVWVMNASGQRQSAGFPGDVGLDWVIRGLGDVDGDQVGDVVWRNTDNGSTAIWLIGSVITRGITKGCDLYQESLAQSGVSKEWVISMGMDTVTCCGAI